MYDRLGFDRSSGDSHLVIKKRALIVKWASNLGVEDCTRKCVEAFAKWMGDSESFR